MSNLTPNMIKALRLLAGWNWRHEPVCFRPNKVAYRALRARGLVGTKLAMHSSYNRHSCHTTVYRELGAWLTPEGREDCRRRFGIEPAPDSKYASDARMVDCGFHHVLCAEER